jgi:hypothetical protein
MAKKTARKNYKAVAAKGREPAKQAAPKKPARTGGSHVKFGLHGMAKIMQKVHEAGLGSEFNEALDELGHDKKFVKVQPKSLQMIKEFVASKPKLASLAAEMGDCDCPPDDPGCIYI